MLGSLGQDGDTQNDSSDATKDPKENDDSAFTVTNREELSLRQNHNKIPGSFSQTLSKEAQRDEQWNKRLGYNLAPQSQIPVYRLVQEIPTKSLQDPQKDIRHAVSFFKWGMDLGFGASGSQYSTFNCRVESLENPKSAWYKFLGNKSNSIPSLTPDSKVLNVSHRCVILAEGYYEWKTMRDEGSSSKPKKMPYYVTMTKNKEFYEFQRDNQKNTKDAVVEAEDEIDETTDLKSTPKRELVYFAGLYNNDTATIITKPAQTAEMEWLHSREPVMLRTVAEIQRWLAGETEEPLSIKSESESEKRPSNFNMNMNMNLNLNSKSHLTLLYSPHPLIYYYRVSKAVGNVKITASSLNIPLTKEQIKEEDDAGSIKPKKRKPEHLDTVGGRKVAKITSFFQKKT